MYLRSMCLSGHIRAFIYRNYCAKGFRSKLNILEYKGGQAFEVFWTTKDITQEADVELS